MLGLVLKVFVTQKILLFHILPMYDYRNKENPYTTWNLLKHFKFIMSKSLISPLIKPLACKHGDLSLNPQNPCESW